MTPEQILEAARVAADLLLALAPTRARELLTDAEIKQANAVADAAEQAKFGRQP